MIEAGAYSAPIAALIRRALRTVRPLTRLTVSQFADAELVVTSGPLSGTRWRTDTAPYQRGILDACLEPGVEYVIVQSSAQVGKTSLSLAVVAYHVAHDPCAVLVVAPTVKPMAEDWSKNRLEPLISASPLLAQLFAKKRRKDSSNTVLSKTFRGGALSIGGANSAASLASRSIRLLVLDEIDRYPAELPGEGSTIAIAIKRTTSFRGRRRVLMLSTPTVTGAPIDTWFGRGDQRRFHVPCPICGALFSFAWSQVRWTDADPSTARLYCPHCDHGLDDTERLAALAHGTWIADRPDRSERNIVSFHLWEAMSPWASLPEMVATFLHARAAQKAGDAAELHTFINTALGEPIDAEQKGDGLEPDQLLARREVFAADVPHGACVLTAGIDVQDDRLELLVIGWGPGEESWIIDRRTCAGDTSQPGPWEALDVLLERRYRHASGLGLAIEGACIDSGGHRTTTVYDYASKHSGRRMWAVKGYAGDRAIVSSPLSRQWGRKKRTVPLFMVGVDAAKSLLMGRLAVAAGAGGVHLPLTEWCDSGFLGELTAERMFTQYQKGRPVQVWKKIRTRNEALDCFVYAIAALRLLRPSFPDYADVIAKATDAQPRPVSTVAAPTSRWIQPRRNWLRGRR